MPRSNLTKDIIKSEVLKIFNELNQDDSISEIDKKSIKIYLFKILDKIEEYRY